MTADCQPGLRKGQKNGGGKIRPSRHQRGGAEGACLLELNDGLVHAWRETKVVRVDDQAFHFRSVPSDQTGFSDIEAVGGGA